MIGHAGNRLVIVVSGSTNAAEFAISFPGIVDVGLNPVVGSWCIGNLEGDADQSHVVNQADHDTCWPFDGCLIQGICSGIVLMCDLDHDGLIEWVGGQTQADDEAIWQAQLTTTVGGCASPADPCGP